MLKFVFVYLANTAVVCYSLTIICCYQVQDYIYWIISTENDHRHHHKFIKYEKTIEKRRKKHARLTYQAKSLPLQREFGSVAFPWVRSNGQTDPLHISCICSIWKILHFYSTFSLNPSKSAFFHALTLSLLPKSHMLFIVSKQCTCSRRVHIEGHMNRFEFLLSWTIIPIVIVLGLFCQKIVSFAA
jgi:hypothetical protein